ncbi:hypothetical protein HBA55_34775 [Pseudomaricurvus alkylphenolicus]|uniref:hypothetical protein n=1 Tax=Pseudomaricurvus alkylphenolicus TaxID=1306991 RepID=UPI00141F673D|nr:hypothetical protein [Pseudomaricurvus alkylphenolicus]NIB44797.1 hypothetical protein [Pseudomaricurvus alkylphenolicus]
MLRTNKIVLGLILTLATALAVFVFNVMAGPTILGVYFGGELNDNLRFSFERCDDQEDAWKDSISRKYWNGNTLIVEGYAVPNCGTTWLFGDYHLDGNHISLIYKPIMPSLAACVCAFDVEYQIAGLEKGDYTLSIAEEGGIFVEDSWYRRLLDIE